LRISNIEMEDEYITLKASLIIIGVTIAIIVILMSIFNQEYLNTMLINNK
jgi:hypothetical protein